MIILKIITLLFFLTQLGDWYTTRTIINKGGVELNPVMKAVFSVLPMDLALCLKAVGITALLWYVNNLYATAGATLIYLWVVWHNYEQLKK